MESILESVGLSGPAEDSAIREIDNGQVIVSNVDIFTPIIDDPVIQGEITACNVTNDIFATNTRQIISYLSFLGVPTDQPQSITEGILSGQRKFLKQFGADVTGGHTITNPWPLMGGLAVGLGKKEELIPKQIEKNGLEGELILTKPLGVQAAMACYRVRKDTPEFLDDYDPDMISRAIKIGVNLMRTSNYYVVDMIHKEDYASIIPAMTDVTGFGIKIHAGEMIQNLPYDIEIDTLPIIEGMDELSEIFGYGLLEGLASETAGPMLLSIDNSLADTELIQNKLREYGIPSWRVGLFRKGKGNVIMKEDMNIVNVSEFPEPYK